MPGITLADAEAKLQTWQDAEDALASAQSITHNGRHLTRADLAAIGDRITYWNGMVNRLSRGGPALSRVTIHD